MTRSIVFRHWLQQFVGVLILLLTVWAFLNTPDQRGWNLALSAILGLASLAIAAWLVASNLAGAARPRLSQLAWIAVCLMAFLLLIWLLGYSETSWNEKISAWIASAVSLKFKKPLPPERVNGWLEWLSFGIRWLILPLLFLPLVIRASGSRPVGYVKLLLLYLAAFLVGAVVPHYIVHWVPKLPGFWPQLMSAMIRFLIAYAILITAWVLLGRSTRAEVRP